MLCTSKIHPLSLGNYLGALPIIGNLMRIRVTGVERNVDFALVDEREKNRLQNCMSLVL